MVDFSFFPHTCHLFRDSYIDPITGKESPYEYFEGMCYLEQSSANMSSNRYRLETIVHLPIYDVEIKQGDDIVINDGCRKLYSGKIKQVYPIKDNDIGGIDIEVYEQ